VIDSRMSMAMEYNVRDYFLTRERFEKTIFIEIIKYNSKI
jgi:hypothetical protein